MTTNLTTNLTSDAQAIIDVAQVAAESEQLALGGYYVVPARNGPIQVDLTSDRHRRTAGLPPLAKAGTVTVRDVRSFLSYFTKHASEYAEVYADRDAASVTGILDAHEPAGGDPHWQQHRVVLALRYSPQFEAWRNVSGRMMTQTAFAEFIEDNRACIVTPDAATVLELAQTFQATNRVQFKSSHLLKTGQRQLSYVEQVDATAGQRGDIQVPDALQLALPVYDGAKVADPVAARLRFRIDPSGQLGLGVVLDQLVDVVNAAFEGVIAEIVAGLGDEPPVLRGTPA